MHDTTDNQQPDDEGQIPNPTLGGDGVSNATPAADHGPEGDIPDATPDDNEDSFDRAYVEDLRKESAGYRTQLRTVQEQLHTVLAEQTGRLADPSDLPFDPEHLDDPAKLTAAIDALIEAKPHLKRRAFASGAAAQGPKSSSGEASLLDIMRAGF